MGWLNLSAATHSIRSHGRWLSAVITALAGPMNLSWLPSTTQGRMFGDYISTSVPAGGNAVPALSVASAPSGGKFNQAMFVPAGGIAVSGGGLRSATAEVAQPQPSPMEATRLGHRKLEVPSPQWLG